MTTTITRPRSVSRRSFLAGTLGSAAALTAACSGGGSSTSSGSPNNVQLIAVNFPPQLSTLDTMTGPEFTKRTSVSVTVINTGSEDYNSVDQRILADAAAGTTADIAAISQNMVSTYAAKKVAQPLDQFVNDSSFDKSQFRPSLLALGKAGDATMGMPWSTSVPVLFYNADAFRRAGLDPDKPPATYPELEEYAKALVTSKAVRYGATFQNNTSANWLFQNFILTAGGKIADPAGKPVFNDDAGQRAFSFWRELFARGYGETMDRENARAAFTRGDLGMVVLSSANTLSMQKSAKFDLRCGALPIPEGGTRTVVPSGSGLIMLAKDPARQASAWKVIAELLSPQGVTTLVKSSGYAPTNTVAESTPELLGDFYRQNPIFVAGNSQLENLTSWYAWPGNRNTEITQAIDEQVFLALTGKKTVATALADAAERAAAMSGQ